MKVLVVVPARSGSRRLPNKNILWLGGMPLLCWSLKSGLDFAKQSPDDVRVILDTDSREYIEVADKALRQNGLIWGDVEIAPYIRSPELAGDVDTGLVLREAHKNMIQLYNFNADIIILLQPTSPFRSVRTIEGCVDTVTYRHPNEPPMGWNDCGFSAKKVKEFPQWMFNHDGSPWLGFPTRHLSGLIAQDLPPLYIPSGSVYATKRATILKGQVYGEHNAISPVDDPYESIDIETGDDFSYCQYLVDSGRVKLD